MTTDVISEFEEVVPDEAEVTEAVVDAYEKLPLDFRKQWDVVRMLTSEELVERVHDDFGNEPEERRDVLTAYLAQRLGYLWHFSRKAHLRTKPLWDLQERSNFEELDESDRRIVWMIAGSTKVSRPTLHPSAALAAIALWRFGDPAENERAERLLAIRGLPDDYEFLHELVRSIGRKKVDADAGPGRTFHDLARLLNRSGYRDTAARIGGLQLIRRYDAWWFGPPEPNLRVAVEKASLTDPFQARPWIDLIADATVAGELRWDWPELAMEAAIRMELNDAERRRQLRGFHRRRLYAATSERLAHLFRFELRDLARAPAPILSSRPGRRLLEEVELAELENPVRAMKLLELVLGTAAPQLFGTPHTRIHEVLEHVTELNPWFEKLLVLYVRCLVLEPQAAEFVRRFREEVNWDTAIGAERADVDTFFLVTDYEAPFAGRTAEFEGIKVSHVERDAATRVRYFVMRRHRPSTITGLVTNVELPERWIANAIGNSQGADVAFQLALDGFLNRVIVRDGRSEALRLYRKAGVELERWEDVRELPITTVEAVTRKLRHRGLVYAGVAGGVAGAFAPATTGLSAFADMPIVMHQLADLVADYCWAYGIDPRRRPEVPQQILSVALRGVAGADAGFEATREVLQKLTFRKSLLVAAIAQRAIPQLLAPALQTGLGAMRSSRTRKFVRSAVVSLQTRDDDLRSRVVDVAQHAALPIIAGFGAAILDVSLIYDVCESARAVLSDRFFDRKYDDWTPFFSRQTPVESDEEPALDEGSTRPRDLLSS